MTKDLSDFRPLGVLFPAEDGSVGVKLGAETGETSPIGTYVSWAELEERWGIKPQQLDEPDPENTMSPLSEDEEEIDGGEALSGL